MIRIMCAVCHRQVDRATDTPSDGSFSRTIRVWCHGATESMELTDAFLADAGPNPRITEAVAFGRPPAIIALREPE